MKSLTQKLVVSTIVAFLIGGITVAEDPPVISPEPENPKIDEERFVEQFRKVEIIQKDGRGLAASPGYGAYAGHGLRSRVNYGGAYYGAVEPRGVSLGTGADEQNVHVIPWGEVKPEKLTEAIEDMSVMSGIFARELREGGLIEKREGYKIFPLFGRDVPNIRSIYLEGYGALFLIDVDFPLAPAEEVEQDKRGKSGLDKVWVQAKRELYSGHQTPEADSGCPKPEYDPRKVATLKTKLIDVSLKHASNIRGLVDKDWIVVTVSGWGGRVREARLKFLDRKGQIIVPALSAEKTDFTPRTVLVIRARKADVDLFAKGELDLDGFRSRLETVMY